MGLLFNSAFRTILADAFADEFDAAAGTLKIYTTGKATLLSTITLPFPAFGAASVGVVNKTGTWQDTNAAASGAAAVAVLENNGATLSVDMTVTATSGGGDIELDDVNIVAGGTVTISTFTYTQPAS